MLCRQNKLGLIPILLAVLLCPIVFDALVSASTLKNEVVNNLDIMIVRELTGGVYFGQPRGIEDTPNGKKAIDTQIYYDYEIDRIARVAFDLARKRNNKVTSVEKANVMETGVLWREIVKETHKDFSDITLENMLADNCAMQLVRNPKQFDVIVTDKLRSKKEIRDFEFDLGLRTPKCGPHCL